jgi:hypothetical protein
MSDKSATKVGAWCPPANSPRILTRHVPQAVQRWQCRTKVRSQGEAWG